MPTAPEILSLAVRAGLVDGVDAVSGAAGVIPLPRTNQVHCVQLRGRPVAYCKQPGLASRFDGDDVVAAEARALRSLQSLGLTPPLIGGIPSTAVWTRAVAGQDLVSWSSSGREPSALPDALGAALARLHSTPTDDLAPAARPPWPLLAEPLASMATHPPETHRDAVLATWREPRIQNVIRPLVVAWERSRGWTHGDLSAANIVVTAEGRVTFIDLESAGRGDPGWDVITVEETLRAVGLSPARFRAAYAAAGGPAVPPQPAWRTVRALVTAWQHAALPDPRQEALIARLLTDARHDTIVPEETP